MQSLSTNPFTRPDTLFGVCQAIGEDFGFNPLILRIAFSLPLFWNPYLTVGAYLALGLLVALSRWFAPNPSVAPLADADIEETAEVVEEPELALAA